ncbi:hypothetical protein ACLOJK_033628 [Asimina triloba]
MKIRFKRAEDEGEIEMEKQRRRRRKEQEEEGEGEGEEEEEKEIPSSAHRPIMIPDSWSEAADFITYDSSSVPISFICGPKNSGKTTFSRHLLNTLLTRYKTVAYLDTDVGQTEFTTPGCLSLHLINEPSPGITPLLASWLCLFFGDTSSKRDPKTYLKSIFYLYDYYYENYYQTRGDGNPGNVQIPLIVNTAGWVKGIGYDVLVEMLRHMEPTHVVQLRISPNSKNLPTGAFWTNGNQSGQVNLIEINAAFQNTSNRSYLLPVNTNHLVWGLTLNTSSVLIRKDGRLLRDIRIIAYFRQCLPSDMDITTNKELADALASHPPHQAGEVPSNEVLHSLNATIVGLAVSSRKPTDSESCTPWCIGLGSSDMITIVATIVLLVVTPGLIRGIDISKDLLYVITPVPHRNLASVDMLLQGFIDIPSCLVQTSVLTWKWSAIEQNDSTTFITDPFEIDVLFTKAGGISKYHYYENDDTLPFQFFSTGDSPCPRSATISMRAKIMKICKQSIPLSIHFAIRSEQRGPALKLVYSARLYVLSSRTLLPRFGAAKQNGRWLLTPKTQTEKTIARPNFKYIRFPTLALPLSGEVCAYTRLAVYILLLNDKYERDARKYWDIFYKRHQDKFFKDRHYLDKEWGHYFDVNRTPHNIRFTNGATRTIDVTWNLIGCGAGNTIFPLIALYPDIFVYACDFSPRAIDLVKAHKDFREDHVNAFVCDLTVDDLSEKILPSTVDIVTMIFVLSAIAPEKMPLVLQNIKKVLKPNGHVLLRDYAVGDLAQERLTCKDQKISDNFYVRGDGTRAFYFSEDFLTSLFKSNGFDIEEIGVCCKQVENRSRELLMNRRWIQAVLCSGGLYSCVTPAHDNQVLQEIDVTMPNNGNIVGESGNSIEIDMSESIAFDMFGLSQSIHEIMEINLRDYRFRIKGLSREYQHTCNSTGLMLWESARLMSAVLVENPSLVAGKKVLELGCGCAGICSMVAVGSADLVVATDGDVEALDLLRQNIAVNLEPVSINKLVTKQLEWGNENHIKAVKEFNPEGFQVIIGTDVIYVPEAIMPLFETARKLISVDGSVKSRPALILCHVVRRVDEASILLASSTYGFKLVDKWVTGTREDSLATNLGLEICGGIISSWFAFDFKETYSQQSTALNIMYFEVGDS